MAILDNLFGAPPEYLTGLLAPDQTDKLRKQAMTTGLINSAIALIAQPRNQRYGSALPYIGKALMAGQQAGQGVYSNALQGLETQQKLAEFKRKQEQRIAQENAISQLPPEQQQMYRAFGDAAVSSILKKPERKTQTIGNQIVDVTGDEAKVLFTGAPDEKIGASTTLNKLITERSNLAKSNPNDPNLKFYDDAIRKETSKSEGINISYGAPVPGVNAQGEQVFFQPAKGGGAPAIIPGVSPPPREEKPTTEGEKNAAGFATRMQEAEKLLSGDVNANIPAISVQSQKPGVLESGVGFFSETGANFLRKPERQMGLQAQRDWVRAKLRKESGATIGDQEMQKEIETYFPQIGDSPGVIKQKSDARQIAIQGMINSAGRASKEQYLPRNSPMPSTGNWSIRKK
jgi:hypothetical protein